MGFLNWLWSLFTGGESRLKKEKEEEKDEFKSIKLTEEEKGIEKKENKQLAKIIIELERIHKKLHKEKKNVEIKVGNQIISVDRAVYVLIINLNKLRNTSASIKQEEKTLARIRSYWNVARQGLSSPKVQRDIRKIDSLFNELGIELKIEEKLSWQKILLVKKEYNLITEEAQGKSGQKSPNKVKV